MAEVKDTAITLQWGPRTAEFKPHYTNHWGYRFADMSLLLDRDIERGKGTYSFGECSGDSQNVRRSLWKPKGVRVRL